MVECYWSNAVFIGLSIVLKASHCVFLNHKTATGDRKLLIKLISMLAGRFSVACMPQYQLLLLSVWLMLECWWWRQGLIEGMIGDMCANVSLPHLHSMCVPYDNDNRVSSNPSVWLISCFAGIFSNWEETGGKHFLSTHQWLWCKGRWYTLLYHSYHQVTAPESLINISLHVEGNHNTLSKPMWLWGDHANSTRNGP